MECNNQKCLNTHHSKPIFDVHIISDKNNNYCSNKCKFTSLSKYIKEDVDNFMYIEKFVEECYLCSIGDVYLVELSCNHKFCNTCMKKIFDGSTKCPTCRMLMLMKSENDKVSDMYRESLTSEHMVLIDTVYKLVNSIEYDFNRDLLSMIYFQKTNRDVGNDINLIKDYFNMFKDL